MGCGYSIGTENIINDTEERNWISNLQVGSVIGSDQQIVFIEVKGTQYAVRLKIPEQKRFSEELNNFLVYITENREVLNQAMITIAKHGKIQGQDDEDTIRQLRRYIDNNITLFKLIGNDKTNTLDAIIGKTWYKVCTEIRSETCEKHKLLNEISLLVKFANKFEAHIGQDEILDNNTKHAWSNSNTTSRNIKEGDARETKKLKKKNANEKGNFDKLQVESFKHNTPDGKTVISDNSAESTYRSVHTTQTTSRTPRRAQTYEEHTTKDATRQNTDSLVIEDVGATRGSKISTRSNDSNKKHSKKKGLPNERDAKSKQRKDLPDVQYQIQLLKAKNESLLDEKRKLEIEKQTNEEELKKKNAEIAELTDRLASEMNAKISANEESLENISITCRPMNVAETYSMFVSNAWLEAKQVLDKNMADDEIIIGFLVKILCIGSACAEMQYSEVMKSLKILVKNPMNRSSSYPKPGGKDSVNSTTLSTVLQAAFGDHLRQWAAEIDISPLKKDIIEKMTSLEKFGPLKKLLKNKHIAAYIEGSAHLAWQMAIQRPQMKFDQPDLNKPFQGETVHPLAWGSKPGKKSRIKYYLYPSLYHGDKVMVAGKVYVS